MKKFEIHITGNYKIISVLKLLNLKSLIVELLNPTGEIFRTEYMSSFIKEYSDYTLCLKETMKLVEYLKQAGVNVIRVKIETPFYPEYVNMSQYIEAHFKPFKGVYDYPISRNKNSGKLMATAREYLVENYAKFRNKWADVELELCVFDSFISEDHDWFLLYKRVKPIGKKFIIYHPSTGDVNLQCLPFTYSYKQVAIAYADNLFEAYDKSQRDSSIYRKFEIRSTAVGDVIENNHGHYFIILNKNEMKRVSHLNWINWNENSINHPKDEDLYSRYIITR